MLKYVIPKTKNVIAISTLLENYYNKKQCNTVRIPTVIDMQEYVELSFSHNEKLVIAYAGMPAKNKDFILNVLEAMLLLRRNELDRIEFRIFGLTKDQLINSNKYNQLGDSLKCMGKIPYLEVKSEIAKADFTVLLRPGKRYANAGFPTKVGESMACGVPVITNMTSDLNLYVVDEVNGVICDNESPEACAAALRRALQLTSQQKKEMRTAALQTAYKNFDYKVYVRDMREFLENLK
jgi:glycosyltransferase involved in cell wall biosynthesis